MKYNLIALACAVLLAVGLSLTVTAGPTEPDTDSDGVVDQHDNCSAFANATQYDTDQDGYGQVCDGDFTNNNIVNLFDFASFKNAYTVNPYNEQCDHTCNGVINLFDFASFKNLYVGAPGPSGQTCAGPKGGCPGNPTCP